MQYAQSNALLVYAGTFSDLTPLNPLAALQVNEVLGGIEDATATIIILEIEKDAEKLKAIGAELMAADGMICLDFCTSSTAFLFTNTGALNKWVARFDKQLAQNGTGYLVGSSLTVADLKAFTFFSWFTDGAFPPIPGEWILSFSNIAAFQAKVAAHPKIAEYYTTHK